jgi:Skp family chaperone for outer membrane proteins
MADVKASAGGTDEGLSNLEAFVALLTETRHVLGERQANLDARAEALGQQAAAAPARFAAFNDAVSGLAESFATTSQAASSDLARLALTCTELADQVRGAGAEALRASEARFVAAAEGARASLEQGAARITQGLDDIESAVDDGDEGTAAAVSDQEEGFVELVDTVAATDTSFSQADFDLQGVLEATAAYVGEGLEQYVVTVFSAFYEHLQNDLPRLLIDLFQDLGQTLHRTLDEYDGHVESVSDEMASENETQAARSVRTLRAAQEEREEDRERSLQEMRALLEEAARCRASAGRGSEICNAYPPIVPLLAAAREVADRVQEMMDVFNPFGG